MRAAALFAPRAPLPRPADALWRRLGLAGAPGAAALVGAVLLLLAAVASFALAPAWQAQATQSRAQAQAARAERLAAADRARFEALPATMAFPAAGNESQRVQTLLGLAARHGVRVHALRQERVTRGDSTAAASWHRVAMGAEGAYPALRRFVAAALQADAALALDSLLLQRADGTTPLLRAELGWALASGPP